MLLLLARRQHGAPEETRRAFAAGSSRSSRGSPMDRATAWLSRSAEGYCAVTTGPGDCSHDVKGSWTLHPHEVGDGWLGAVRACLKRCAGCERCNSVSLSVRYADCSWFHSECSASNLHVEPSSFRSAPARANSTWPTRHNTRLERRARWVGVMCSSTFRERCLRTIRMSSH